MTDQPMDHIDLKQRNRNRWVLIGLAALFMVPVMVAIYLNSNLTDWRPGSLNVHGTLIEPVAPIVAAESMADAPWHEQRWSMLVDASEGCEAACQQAVAVINQVHPTLGRLAPKIERVVLVRPGQTLDPAWDVQTLVGAGVLTVSLPAEHHNAAVYLVDPFGNLMMRYAHGLDPTGLRKDLQRLLKHDFE